ncbi:hypothetical protein BD779DRAFT_1555181 [Infundibulicybe gibba]|nr:hypothetical protein BD779DRAFT_1555181 [Infundibulicybe gibba]
MGFDNTLGAAFIGAIGASILFGITNLQVFLYYHSYPEDWRVQKLIVALLWLLDVVHLILTVHAVYHYVVTSFGNPLALLQVVWSLKLQIAVNVIIVLLVQSLYAARVWKLGYQNCQTIPWIVLAIVILGYAVGIILAVKTYQISSFDDLNSMSWAIYASFAMPTIVDFVIAATICYYLQTNRSGFSEANSRIVVVMRYVLISGFATSVCSTVALITYSAMPRNLVFLGIEFLLTKLYVNSFLAMLNARRSLRRKDTTNASTASRMVNLRLTGTAAGSHDTPDDSPKEPSFEYHRSNPDQSEIHADVP